MPRKRFGLIYQCSHHSFAPRHRILADPNTRLRGIKGGLTRCLTKRRRYRYYCLNTTIAKFMKDVSKRFFDIPESHPNALLCSEVSYEPPCPHNFIRRPPNVFTDSPDALTAAVESLMELNNTND
ncbi:hypothetical protein EVAR_49489_1 [Eumeta japonica]|uniref:Uncharacterized protein n=1 Tax=Eumeta variegata TaxID=151549 RepID=A0A4C1VW35_EUMVA|nr:hypothetical protein EVAR_49489_1 [Eumeta japonica]